MMYHQETRNGVSLDAVYDGRLALFQSKNGYRLSVDALLLTYFVCTGKAVRRGVDLGTGCGVVGLGLLLAQWVDAVVGVEIQPRLAALASQNAELNQLNTRFQVVTGDLRDQHHGLTASNFDLVVSNPPFWPMGTGRPPANEERRLACHESHGDIYDWMSSAARLLNQKRGRFALVFPSQRLDDLFDALGAAHLHISRLRPVHPTAGADAELVLVEARWGKRGHVRLEPALVLKDDTGRDTPEASSIVSGQFSPALCTLEDKRPKYM